jgi:hypothetical protein
MNIDETRPMSDPAGCENIADVGMKEGKTDESIRDCSACPHRETRGVVHTAT